MTEPRLSFRPIDLSKNLEDTVRFREDSYLCSFGHAQAFQPEVYLNWLKSKLQADPQSAVHVWLGTQLVGQMELGSYKPDPQVGYVNLYYLVPEFRGRGLSVQLDEYAISHLKSKGFKKAYLSVSPSNERAIRYYKRLGWISLGQRADAPEVEMMEKELS